MSALPPKAVIRGPDHGSAFRALGPARKLIKYQRARVYENISGGETRTPGNGIMIALLLEWPLLANSGHSEGL